MKQFIEVLDKDGIPEIININEIVKVSQDKHGHAVVLIKSHHPGSLVQLLPVSHSYQWFQEQLLGRVAVS